MNYLMIGLLLISSNVAFTQELKLEPRDNVRVRNVAQKEEHLSSSNNLFGKRADKLEIGKVILINNTNKFSSLEENEEHKLIISFKYKSFGYASIEEGNPCVLYLHSRKPFTIKGHVVKYFEPNGNKKLILNEDFDYLVVKGVYPKFRTVHSKKLLKSVVYKLEVDRANVKRSSLIKGSLTCRAGEELLEGIAHLKLGHIFEQTKNILEFTDMDEGEVHNVLE